MADAKIQVAEGEQAEAKPSRPEYDIVQSQREEPEDKFTAQHFQMAGAGAQAQGQKAAGEAPIAQPRLPEGPIQRLEKLAASQTKVYAAIGIGLGLLAGLAVAVIFLHPGGQGGPNDLGAVTSSAYGLKGHLVTKWGDKLEYHLTLEPSGPGQRAAFLAAVMDSPRPLSVGIQLKDPFGAVLCGNTILLKFDPRNAPVSAAPDPKPRSKKAAEAMAAQNQIAQSIDLARLEGQELDREHGKDVFQNNAGPDGQVASISAQGNMPCTKKQYDNIASWSFTSDFPIVAEQAQSPNPASGLIQNGEPAPAGKTPDAATLPVAKKIKREPAPKAPYIYIEGDDSIIWYDAAAGIVETSAGKALLVDRTNAGINTLKGREFPIDIHYRCDQAGNCTFAGIGLGVQHAKLRR